MEVSAKKGLVAGGKVWPIFVSYRRPARDLMGKLVASEASAEVALWLKRELGPLEITTSNGEVFALRVFVDQDESSSSNWRKKLIPMLEHSRALIVVLDKEASEKRNSVDYLYEELEWWAQNRRKTPPIILQLDSVSREKLTSRPALRGWSNAGALDCFWDEWNLKPSELVAEKRKRLLERIVESIRNYGEIRHLEEIERLLRANAASKRRARLAMALAVCALIAMFVALWFRTEAVGKQRVAVSEASAAQDLLLFMAKYSGPALARHNELELVADTGERVDRYVALRKNDTLTTLSGLRADANAALLKAFTLHARALTHRTADSSRSTFLKEAMEWASRAEARYSAIAESVSESERWGISDDQAGVLELKAAIYLLQENADGSINNLRQSIAIRRRINDAGRNSMARISSTEASATRESFLRGIAGYEQLCIAELRRLRSGKNKEVQQDDFSQMMKDCDEAANFVATGDTMGIEAPALLEARRRFSNLRVNMLLMSGRTEEALKIIESDGEERKRQINQWTDWGAESVIRSLILNNTRSGVPLAIECRLNHKAKAFEYRSAWRAVDEHEAISWATNMNLSVDEFLARDDNATSNGRTRVWLQVCKDADGTPRLQVVWASLSSQARSIIPTSKRTITEMADAQRKQGNYTVALKLYEEVSQLNPEDSEPVYEIAFTLHMQDRNAEALRRIEAAIKLDGEEKDALFFELKGDILNGLGDKSGAREAWGESVSIDPKNDDALSSLGDSYSEDMLLSDALVCYLRALECDPTVVQHYVDAVRVFSLEGEGEKAMEVVERGIKALPGDEQLKAIRGQLAQLDRYFKANGVSAADRKLGLKEFMKMLEDYSQKEEGKVSVAAIVKQGMPIPDVGHEGHDVQWPVGDFKISSIRSSFAVGSELSGSYEAHAEKVVVTISGGEIGLGRDANTQNVLGMRAKILEWSPKKKSFNPVAESDQFVLGKTLTNGKSIFLKTVTMEIPLKAGFSFENRWLAFEYEVPGGTCYTHLDTFIGTNVKNGTDNGK